MKQSPARPITDLVAINRINDGSNDGGSNQRAASLLSQSSPNLLQSTVHVVHGQ
jgi:hypothetical protein